MGTESETPVEPVKKENRWQKLTAVAGAEALATAAFALKLISSTEWLGAVVALTTLFVGGNVAEHVTKAATSIFGKDRK